MDSVKFHIKCWMRKTGEKKATQEFPFNLLPVASDFNGEQAGKAQKKPVR